MLKYLSITKEDFPIASNMFEEKSLARITLMIYAIIFRSPHLGILKTINGTYEKI